MKLIILTVIISISPIVSSINSNCSDPLVKTRWSWLRGFTQELFNVPVHHFLGIPYALPPVGPLRFKPSIPLGATHLRHKGIYNATSYRFGCIQTPEDEASHSTIPSSENCLFINVYTPANLSFSVPTNPDLPVLVFIHGSGFVYGSSGNPHIYGGYLAALGNMVFVVFNYRLGALGLMYGHPTKIPGNLALWDQKAALQWVHDNIQAFGGNPNRVTLMGHSAGATYSTIHLMSTQTRPLFQQAMVMSGIACERSALDSPALALMKTREVTSRLNCSRITSKNAYLNDEEIDCLMKVDALEIARAQGSLESSESSAHCASSIFFPSYGNIFLPHSTDTLAERGDHVHGKPILVGKVPIETFAQLNVTNLTSAVTEIQSYITKATGVVHPDHLEAILKYYLDSIVNDDYVPLTGAVLAALNDLCQHCPLLSFSRQWATGNPVYQYYYTYVTDSYKDDPARAYGPVHADDTKILFGLPFKEPEQYTDRDRKVSLFMISLWSHFVHKGSMEWPPVLINSIDKKISTMYQYEIDGNTTTVNYKDINIDKDSVICGLLP